MDDSARKLTEEEGKLALRIARLSLEAGVLEEPLPDAEVLGVPPTGVFRQRRAAFVTLMKNNCLRGCIGHVLPIEELWRSIRNNAVAAALHDHRFRQVTPEELKAIALDVSILTTPVPVPDYTHFIPGVHGILLEVDSARSVFLPQVASEQGWDRPTTLSHLSLKAGLPADDWKSPRARFKIFEAQVFEEHQT